MVPLLLALLAVSEEEGEEEKEEDAQTRAPRGLAGMTNRCPSLAPEEEALQPPGG